MESVQKQRRLVFYNNLILLEFNEGYMERKHKIPFNKDMFAVPNKKGFEVISHFLFSKLNEVIGEEEYKIIFPVLDKSQAEEFRRTCYTHLNRISQQGDAGMPFPQIVPSIFLSPGGEKFYELYLAFSTYVIQKFIEKDGIVKLNYLPPLISTNQKTLPSVLQLRTNASMNRFVEIQKAALDNQQKLEDKANKLTAVYRNVKKKLKDTENLLQERVNQMSASGTINVEDSKAINDFMQDLTNKNKEPLAKIKQSWSTIENALAKEKELWEIVRTELATEEAKKYTLDGKDYMLLLPYLDTTKCYSELEKRKLHSVYKDGKLCLISFIDMWMICMDHYMKIFSQGKVSKLSPSAEHSMREALDTLSMNLNVTKTLSERIASDLLPPMKQNVQKLQSSALSKLNVTCQDTKWIDDMLFRETSPTMEQLNVDESITTQSVTPGAHMITVDNSFLVTSSRDQSILSCEQLPFPGQVIVPLHKENLPSPTYKQSLFPLKADTPSIQEETSTSQPNKERFSFSSISEDACTVRQSFNEKQDSLNLIISPQKEYAEKMDTPKSVDHDMCTPHYIPGWSSREQESFILSPTVDSLNEEDLLDTTLPSVPFFDSNSSLLSSM